MVRAVQRCINNLEIAPQCINKPRRGSRGRYKYKSKKNISINANDDKEAEQEDSDKRSTERDKVLNVNAILLACTHTTKCNNIE